MNFTTVQPAEYGWEAVHGTFGSPAIWEYVGHFCECAVTRLTCLTVVLSLSTVVDALMTVALVCLVLVLYKQQNLIEQTQSRLARLEAEVTWMVAGADGRVGIEHDSAALLLAKILKEPV
ncbi:uncharacterized protein LOC129602382 isoform X2 [Paramacrobiotus metropolitanus]|uniref:uncharacterized protein LOC129602382 isoform X2 n=1 Tax=Paramacrobiotus metropolitanus TaxID=2943436 RepID=UPI0024456E56|nr:uncharacterized protein LOC129602382 isoform X2 [Paramacrobiotus metropolitanus]